MEGMELMYGEAILGGGGDPMSSAALGGKGSGTGKAGPQVISKSMIRLQRIKQDKGTGMDVTSWYTLHVWDQYINEIESILSSNVSDSWFMRLEGGNNMCFRHDNKKVLEFDSYMLVF